MNYKDLLKRAPDHNSPEFLEFLRANNELVAENEDWVIIKNVKYNSPERPWYTAFVKNPQWVLLHSLERLLKERKLYDWEWLRKARERQTIDRFHIHIYQP